MKRGAATPREVIILSPSKSKSKSKSKATYYTARASPIKLKRDRGRVSQAAPLVNSTPQEDGKSG